jgi:phosphoribosylglycinamide formyltransferase-1
MLRIAIFASGNGTNAENIIKYFQNSTLARVVLVLTNKKDAKVLDRAKRLNIKTFYFGRKEFYDDNQIADLLKNEADLLVLAGFLWKVPENIINLFPKKIINIHPALLPKYGGKGMFGMHVHQSVKDNNDLETGITIHYVNKNYDEGAVIFQKKITLKPIDSVKVIAEKVHQLEYIYFPKVIENILSND